MRVAVYTTCLNNLSAIESFLAETKQASLIFIMDLGSTDGSYEALQAAASSDSRIKISEFGSASGMDLAAAKNMLLHMCQNTYADWCVNFDIDYNISLFTPEGWFKALENAVSANPKATNFSVNKCLLQLNKQDDNTTLGISSIAKSTTIVSGTTRAVWEHPVFPVLKAVGDAAHTSIHASTTSFGIYDYLQQNIDYWNKNRTSQLATYYVGRALANSDNIKAFIPTLESSLYLELDSSVELCVEICLLLNSITNDVRYIHRALSFCPTSIDALYSYAHDFLLSEDYWQCVGICHQILKIPQDADNFIVYRDPNVLSKTNHLLSTALYRIDSEVLLGESIKYLEQAIQLDPNSLSLKNDLAKLMESAQESNSEENPT